MGGSETPFGNGTYIPDPLAQFLGRVVPWSVVDPPDSYVNIHAFDGDLATPYRGGGRAFASMAEYGQLQNFTGFLNHIRAQVFFCLSGQRYTGQPDGRGNRKLVKGDRKAINARWLRSFVLDLDVKDKGYLSQEAALAALLPFFDKIGIKPGPIVNTGRGIHAYIVLDQAISRAQWQPLADRLIEAATQHGLKFDVGVTRNSATLLRLPGSFNRKDPNNPLECRVLSLGTIMSLAEVTAALSGFPLTSGVSHSPRAAVDLSMLPPRPPIRGPEANRALANLAAARVVTSIDLLRGACPVVADSERRGGDGDLEPLWFELAKLCHYVQDGRDYFHDLSSEDARYEPEQADAKYDIAEPQGWPACATIARASTAAAAICRTCQFNGQGQSPINFATRGLSGSGTPTITKMNGSVNGHAAAHVLLPTDDPIELLPPGFRCTPERYILDPDGNRVFNQQIMKMEVHFRDTDLEGEKKMTIDLAVPRGTAEVNDLNEFSIDYGLLGSRQKFRERAFGCGLTFDNIDSVMVCMPSWVERVREAMHAKSHPRMGWVMSNGKIEGFTCGGQIFDRNGPRLLTPHRVDERHAPMGTLAGWKQATSLVICKGVIELDIIAATAFAAPLIMFTPVDGVIVFATSSGSGKGKSAALEAGASVWFNKQGKITKTTHNFVVKRISNLNNLPAYFDELPTDAASQRQLANLILQITAGSDIGRLTRQSHEAKILTSRTMMIAAANDSLVQAATRADSDAQGARILEIEVPDTLRSLNISPDQSYEAKDAMNYRHFGVAGQVYGAVLGKHHEAIRKMVVDKTVDIHRRAGLGERGRFWSAAVATIIVGASLAKSLDLFNFDIMSMENYLLGLLKRQSVSLDDMAVNADDPNTQLDRVAEWINRYKQNVIWTADDPLPGRGVNGATLKNYFPDGIQHEFIARVCSDYMLISLAKYKKWLLLPENAGINPHRAVKVLMKHGRCTKPNYHRSLTVGLNTSHPTVSEYVLQFDLSLPENARFKKNAE